jgi:hypothetical protein
MTSWYASGHTLAQTRATLAAKLSAEFYTRKFWPKIVTDHVRERLGYDQSLGPVDLMGWHLHNHLLDDMPKTPGLWEHPRLSEQAATIRLGAKPIPIYTAVNHEHDHYRWVEFTPFEVGIAQDLNVFVPTWAFGRKFKEGTSTDFAIEPSLALLQATWGSAFCATVSQMFAELDGEKDPTLKRVLDQLINTTFEAGNSRVVDGAKFGQRTQRDTAGAHHATMADTSRCRCLLTSASICVHSAVHEPRVRELRRR